MKRLAALHVGTMMLLSLVPTGRADELDDLVERIAPPARFKDYTPSFRVEKRSFTFNHVQGPETKQWDVVMDGDKYVAIHRSGDFNLLALTPELARTSLDMPTGRYHLDTQLGPTLCTHQFLKPVKMHGSIQLEEATGPKDEWVGGGRQVALVRCLKTGQQVTESRFTISVDPVLGYRIDGNYSVRFKNMPSGLTWPGPTFTPGCYPPWPKDRIYDRTVHCPAGGGYRGWANNLICMDRGDGYRKKCSWRDGGFIAHLNPRTGWSVCRTRQDGGGDVSMPVCNAHNDFHVNIPLPAELPKDDSGWHCFKAHHRLLALPPELTRHVWDNVDLIEKGAKGVFISIGEPEDFEDQPKDLTEPERGLCWTSGGPTVATDVARSGSRSLYLKGTSWPNLPQVSCLPNSRFRLEAYFKVIPWTDEEKSAARKADQDRRAKLQAEGKPLPAEIDWDNLTAEAYITAHVYEWTPHSGKWLLRQQTTKATAGLPAGGKQGDKEDWQRVVLEFDTPKWDPNVNIVLEVRNGKAYMDDFSLMRVAPVNPAPKVYPATQGELDELGCTSWPTWTSEQETIRHRYETTETCYITEGEATVESAVGTVTLQAGQMAIFPKGLECVWRIRKTIKKHYKLD